MSFPQRRSPYFSFVRTSPSSEVTLEAALAADGVAVASFAGAATFDAVLASAGAATPAFVGETLVRGDLAAAGVGDAAFVGAATADTALSAAGVGALAFVGAADAAAALASAGTGVFSAVGEATGATTFSSSGVGVFSAVGEAVQEAVFAAAGAGDAAFAGLGLFPADLSAAGAGTFSAVGQATADAVLASTGAGALAATGAATAEGVLAAAGTGALAAAGSSTAEATLAATGTGVLAAAGAAQADAALAAAGAGAASLAGAALSEAVWASAGTAAAEFAGASTNDNQGVLTTDGTGAANFAGAALAEGVLAAAGAGQLAAVGAVVAEGAVSSAGAATAAFDSVTLANGTLNVAGTGALAATGAATANAAFAAQGTGALDAIGAATAAAVANAASAAAANFIGTAVMEATWAAAGVGTFSPSFIVFPTPITGRDVRGQAFIRSHECGATIKTEPRQAWVMHLTPQGIAFTRARGAFVFEPPGTSIGEVCDPRGPKSPFVPPVTARALMTGTSQVSLAGHAIYEAALVAAGAGQMLAVGESIGTSAVLNASGTGEFAAVGAAVAEAMFEMSGTAQLLAIPAQLIEAGFSMAGVSSLALVGEAAQSEGALVAAGAGATAFVGGSIFNAQLLASSSATFTPISTRSGTLAAAGAGVFSAVGRATRAGALAVSAAGAAAFVGRSTRAAALNAAGAGTFSAASSGGGATDPYRLYTALDRNLVEWHTAAGAWGPQQSVEAPDDPVTSVSVDVFNAAQLEVAIMAAAGSATGLLINVHGTLYTGFSMDFPSSAILNLDIVLHDGVHIDGFGIRNLDSPGGAARRLRIRGDGTIENFVLEGYWDHWQVLVDCTSAGDNELPSIYLYSTDEGVVKFGRGFIRARIRSACDSMILTSYGTLVVAATSGSTGNKAYPSEVGRNEAWFIRARADPNSMLILYDVDARGMRGPGEGGQYHRLRVHPALPGTGGPGVVNGARVWIGGDTRFVDQLESRILCVDSSMGIGSPSNRAKLAAIIVKTGVKVWAQGGIPSFEITGNTEGDSLNDAAAYVKLGVIEFHGDFDAGDISVANANNGFVNEGPTFGPMTALPAWGGAGDPSGVMWN